MKQTSPLSPLPHIHKQTLGLLVTHSGVGSYTGWVHLVGSEVVPIILSPGRVSGIFGYHQQLLSKSFPFLRPQFLHMQKGKTD